MQDQTNLLSDLDQGHALTLSALADTEEERGDLLRARAWRQLAQWHKWPTRQVLISYGRNERGERTRRTEVCYLWHFDQTTTDGPDLPGDTFRTKHRNAYCRKHNIPPENFVLFPASARPKTASEAMLLAVEILIAHEEEKLHGIRRRLECERCFASIDGCLACNFTGYQYRLSGEKKSPRKKEKSHV